MASPIVYTTNITTVDCHKQVRSWRLLRSLVELLIPTCNCTFVDQKYEEIQQQEDEFIHNYFLPSFTNITGTIFGSRRGKVNFCIQTNPKSSTPTLLLELAIPTSSLAREMRGGNLRIALVSNSNMGNGFENIYKQSLLSLPLWTMHCNGRKVGYAIKRRASNADLEVLQRMENIVVGAGIINRKEDEIMYLRGNFKRVHGSNNSETFHLIDPEGNAGQELGIFFLRSK